MCPQLICIIGFGRLKARHATKISRNDRLRNFLSNGSSAGGLCPQVPLITHCLHASRNVLPTATTYRYFQSVCFSVFSGRRNFWVRKPIPQITEVCYESLRRHLAKEDAFSFSSQNPNI